MRKLRPCSACSRHVFVDERACPFCGVALVPPGGGGACRLGGVAAAMVVAACGARTGLGGAPPTTDASVADSSAADAGDASSEEGSGPVPGTDTGAPEASDAAAELDVKTFDDVWIPPPYQPPPPPFCC